METIDLTPTWKQILPALLLILDHGSKQSRANAIEELNRMAEAADAWNENARKEQEKTMPKPVKHGLNRNSFVMHQETNDGGDIYIVDQPEGFQFMICDPDGRTRHFPEQNFTSEWEAMKAATAWWLNNPLP